MTTINNNSSNTYPGNKPTSLPSWPLLNKAAQRAQQTHLKTYFNEDIHRVEKLHFAVAGLSADFSRHHINDSIQDHLISLAHEAGISSAIKRLLSGKNVNVTEVRPALHTTLRGPCGPQQQQDQVRQCHAQMRAITQQIHQGNWLGYSGQKITHVVSIGIGGSDLGPRMAATALAPYNKQNLTVDFVANVDPSDLYQALAPLNPATTLFIVASKSWSTQETLTNAQAAKTWLTHTAGPDADFSNHFIAISAQPEKCKNFGIPQDNVLPMWDWVGGRFSLWSAIGLPIALAIGFDKFEQLLAGAHAMDNHFASSPAEQNLPLMMALLEIWYANFWGNKTMAVLPYDHNLRLLPDHLQQLTMESNGKQVDCTGQPVNYNTCPVVWGAAGTNGQHSFHQLLHQGTQQIPIDFILPLSSHTGNTTQHQHMIANCLAQAQALMEGRTAIDIERELINDGHDQANAKRLAAHKAIPGNRPSTIITMDKLTPATLGALIALYEHKVFSASVIWNINPFDQWGVELGKSISATIYTALTSGQPDSSNPATAAAIKAYTRNKSTGNKSTDKNGLKAE
ncbi:MAG: glucose-6-phosphate isomerase [Pseudomonadales bacterium]